MTLDDLEYDTIRYDRRD